MNIKNGFTKSNFRKQKLKTQVGIRQVKIKVRLIIGFVILLIISILLISIMAYVVLKNSITSKATSYSQDIMEQVSFNSRNKLNNVEDIYEKMNQSGLIDDIEKSYTVTDPYEQLTLQTSESIKITELSTFNKSIISLCIIDKNKKPIREMPEFINKDTTLLDKFIVTAKSNNGKFIWLDNNSHVILIKAINNKVTNDYIGTMVIEFASKSISDVYKSVDLGSNSKIFTLNSNGKFISDIKIVKEEETYTNKIFLQKIVDNDKKNINSFQYKVSGENRLIVFSKISNTEMYNIATIPVSNFSKQSRLMGIFLMFIGGICFMVSLYFAYIVSNSITDPLKKFVEFIKIVGKGNLSFRIIDSSLDEIGIINRNFIDMLIRVSSLISEVKGMSNNVYICSSKIDEQAKKLNIASEQVAVTMEQMAKGAKDQAMEVSEDVILIEKLGVEINGITNKMGLVSVDINRSENSIGELIELIDILNDKSEETNSFSQDIIKEIIELNDDMKEIKLITSLIMSISGQTSLLSMNAAIEASRAGEVGRGFSVIAQEVRRLSIQSKDSSMKINNIINEVKNKTEGTVEEANECTRIVNEQINAVNETNYSFRSMSESMNGINVKIEKMKDAVESILKLKDIVLRNIEGIATVSEETSSRTDNVSASTEEQMAGVQELSSMIGIITNLANELNYSREKFKLV